MTVFKTVVDTMLETVPLARRFHGHLKEDPTRLLVAAGAKIEQTRLPMGSKVVEDRELITGQDPYSAKAMGVAFVAKVRRARSDRPILSSPAARKTAAVREDGRPASRPRAI
jgi:putative intracellular protease/amidase